MEGTDVVKGRIDNGSPKARARLAGGMFLLTMLLGGFAKGLIAESIVIPGDASATAANILKQEGLFRLAFAMYLVEMACQIAMISIFYDLLKPVNKRLSLLAAVFGWIGSTIKIISRLFFMAPLFLLGGARYLTAFSSEQLQAFALFSFKIEYLVESIAVIFFGLNALIYGYLFFRSTFLPRILGVMCAVGGFGWLFYLYEPLAARLTIYIVGVALIGALGTVVWLLVFGLDETKWNEKAGVGDA